MPEPEFESDRHFQIWTYGVGHAMLLLRSVKSEDHATRVDVLFVAVDHLDLPTSFDGLRVERSGDTFQLAGNGWTGSVKAANMAHAEDDGEYFDPSPFAEGAGI